MTRATVYALVFPPGSTPARTPRRIYLGTPFGDVDTGLPTWLWEPLDRKVERSDGFFSLSHIRAWISQLPAWQPPRSLLEVARFVEDIGTCMEPELALRLFLESLLQEMRDTGATAVEIERR